MIVPLVSRFKQRFPDIQLQVHAKPSSELVNGLLAHRLDMGICLLPLSHAQLTTMPLFEERLTLVTPAAMKIVMRRTRMPDLALLPLVLMPLGYC